MAGNTRVAVSAAVPPGSRPEHSGADTKLGAARQALLAARKGIAVKPTWLWSKGRLAKRRQAYATSEFKVKFKAKQQHERATPDLHELQLLLVVLVVLLVLLLLVLVGGR